MSDLGASVLSYILPSNREGLEYALQRLTLDHFPDEKGIPRVQRTLFKVLVAYGEKYGDVFPGSFLVDLLKRNNVDESQILLFTETYNLYASREISESAFHYSVDGLIDDYNKQLTGQAITTAYDILERGVEVEGVHQEGWLAASEYALSNLSNLGDTAEDAPEGDMKLEGDSILATYEARESRKETSGILWGLSALDEYTSGIQSGEMCIFAAFTNQGKSQMTAQLAWNASVNQGKNVYFATTETVRNTTMRRILARHSRLPQFGLPRGLNSNDIKNGTLSPDEKAIFYEVVKDFTTNSNYASCYIAQMPRNTTMNYLDQSAKRMNSKVGQIELVVIDYLQLFKSLKSRQSEREEFNDLLRDAKVWCSTFDKGRGVPFITPWQMRQAAWEAAVKVNAYTLASLSDTSEAEKSADMVVSLLRPTPTADEALIQVLKNRDGPLMAPQPVYLDYRCSYIGDTPEGFSSATGEVFMADDLLGAFGAPTGF